jgi:hypothetical protein
MLRNPGIALIYAWIAIKGFPLARDTILNMA